MTTDQREGATIAHEASRTLVKSPPELWAECSDPASLARHLKESFGEIRITRLEPEASVAWEGEHASGTVRIEPSAWGTRVTLTAVLEPAEVGDEEPVEVGEEEPVEVGVEEPVLERAPDTPSNEHDSPQEEADAKVEETVVDPDPAVADDAGPIRRRWRRLIERSRGRLKGEEESPATEEEPKLRELVPPVGTNSPTFEEGPTDAIQPPEPEGPDAGAVLAAALDSLGQAHHRPFSRA